MNDMKRLSLLASLLVCFLSGILTTGCKTPAEVKQALVSLDQGYADNVALMAQYHQLTLNFREREKFWSLYIKQRAKLDNALRWATTDPQSAPPATPEADANISKKLLGTNVLNLVNRYRMKGLPARKGPDSEIIFTEGTNTMTGLIEGIPALVRAVTEQAENDYAQATSSNTNSFDGYTTDVDGLRRINQTIQRYLSIDVTIKPAAVQEIAGSVRTLSRK